MVMRRAERGDDGVLVMVRRGVHSHLVAEQATGVNVS